MYDPQLSRREFLRGASGTAGAVQAAGLYDRAIAAVGAVGGLAGIIGSASNASAHVPGEIRGIKELREYAQTEYHAWLQGRKENRIIFSYSPFGATLTFADVLEDNYRNLSLEVVHTEHPGSRSDLRENILYKMGFSDGIVYRDSDIKGFLGRNDFVEINRIDGTQWETATFFLNGGYRIELYSAPQQGKLCDRPSSLFPGLCVEGTAYFNPSAKNPKPKLAGHYNKPGMHESLLELRKKKIKSVDSTHKITLRMIIDQLKREGKIKI